MTPEVQGYSKCVRCGTWRPHGYLGHTFGVGFVCHDVAWCSKQAGVGKGELTGATP